MRPYNTQRRYHSLSLQQTTRSAAYCEHEADCVRDDKAIELVIEIVEHVPRGMVGDIEAAVLGVILVHERHT